MNRALEVSLLAAVPLWIEKHRDSPALRRQYRAREASDWVAAHGDDLMFGGKHTAETFNRLAEGIALLAYQPGGVTVFGLHWCVGSRHAGIQQDVPGPCLEEADRDIEDLDLPEDEPVGDPVQTVQVVEGYL